MNDVFRDYNPTGEPRTHLPEKMYMVRWESDDLKIGDSLLVEAVDIKPGISVSCYILPDGDDYSPLEEVPSLADQIKDLEFEDYAGYTAEMLEGYEMAKADVLALIELSEEEW